jgi:hypothetical protein
MGKLHNSRISNSKHTGIFQPLKNLFVSNFIRMFINLSLRLIYVQNYHSSYVLSSQQEV